LAASPVTKSVAGYCVPRFTLYDFATYARKPDQIHRVEPRKVIIVEGILVLAEPELRKRIDIKLFVDTPPDIRFLRRLMRDIKTRGRSVESVIEQYMTTSARCTKNSSSPAYGRSVISISDSPASIIRRAAGNVRCNTRFR
jgi:pantothenate kinase